MTSPLSSTSSFTLIERRVDALSNQMDKLLELQEATMNRLEMISQQLLKAMCVDMTTIKDGVQQQAHRQDALERLLSGLQHAVSSIVEVLKLSQLSKRLKSANTHTRKRVSDPDEWMDKKMDSAIDEQNLIKLNFNE